MSGEGTRKEAIALNCGRRVALAAVLRRRLGGSLMNSDALIYQIFSTFNYHVKVLLIADLAATVLTAYRRRRSTPPPPPDLPVCSVTLASHQDLWAILMIS